MSRKFAAAIVIFVVALCARTRGAALQQQAGAASQSAQAPQKPPARQSPAPQTPPTLQQTPPAPQPPQTLRTVVIDPGHGGADTGARGPTGVEEKDVVMNLAREVGDALRAQGFTVVMTRIADVDPSLDDRATVANAQRDAIFISLHVGSTGPAGTVRTYTYLYPSRMPSSIAPSVASNGTGSTPATIGAVRSGSSSPPSAVPANFVPWRRAQKPFLRQSRKLGDLIQVELAEKFQGSPEISASAPVAVLRSVEAPAVAVEISSVAEDPQKLEGAGGDLAAGIARAVAAYKSIYPPGGK